MPLVTVYCAFDDSSFCCSHRMYFWRMCALRSRPLWPLLSGMKLQVGSNLRALAKSIQTTVQYIIDQKAMLVQLALIAALCNHVSTRYWWGTCLLGSGIHYDLSFGPFPCKQSCNADSIASYEGTYLMQLSLFSHCAFPADKEHANVHLQSMLMNLAWYHDAPHVDSQQVCLGFYVVDNMNSSHVCQCR